MDEGLTSPLVLDGSIRAIKFSLSASKEICTSSVNEFPITHPSQLTNPFLGLPVESGKCESCGTAEHGQCEGHFGFIQLPIPIYHPCHISELKRILSMVCLRCLRIKKGKVKHGLGQEKAKRTSCAYCPDLPPIVVNELKTADGASALELRVSSRASSRSGLWSFLDKYGYRYNDTSCRPLLPIEVFEILKTIPEDTKKRLAGRGCFPQDGYVLHCVPVPPNCLHVPEVSDGRTIITTDMSISMLKKLLNKIEHIKKSRSGSPNFESHEAESNDLQAAIAQYMHLRGTIKAPHDITRKKANSSGTDLSTKQWHEKMKTLFISKGSGFSSRSVITGDSYIGVNQIGIPSEIAKKITFEEKVTKHNMKRLQEMVDKRKCVTYRDGSSTYAIDVGSKGHAMLKMGHVVNRQITNGDVVFINRTPSTHKHSLQAFSAFVHEDHDDHTVKINPIICAPFGADFDGDCVHIFYPQSLAARAEALELFHVEHQLISSHSGQFNLQIVHDCLLSLKMMYNSSFLNKQRAQQLSMFVSAQLSPPAVLKSMNSGPLWTILQVVESVLPTKLDSNGDRHMIEHSNILRMEMNRDILQSLFTDIVTSVLMKKGPKETICLLNTLQPLLMELLFLEGFSISLRDFMAPVPVEDDLRKLVDLQMDGRFKAIKLPLVNFILDHSALGSLIDSTSDSAIFKIVQQLGFLGLQLFDRGKFYSRALVEDLHSHFESKCVHNRTQSLGHPSEAYGLIKNSFFHGLDPYEVLVHSISSREVIVRSSRGLSEPGTLFKNLMAILRDVIICYDGTVRNVCSNSIVQLEYGANDGCLPAGEPVGALAATTISHPAYKAVLDSSQSSNSSWELMKEILFCKVNFRNDFTNRRIILYLNDCFCGKRFCKEHAALKVQNCLKSVTLKDCAINFSIVYQKQTNFRTASEMFSGLVGHVHLNKLHLNNLGQSTIEILQKCQDVINHFVKKKRNSHLSRKIFLLASETCCFSPSPYDGESYQFPCLQFSYYDVTESMEKIIHTMANTICPILLDTVIKGDHRVHSANIIWTGPNTASWVGDPQETSKGEVALEVVIEKDEVKRHGDAWRITLDSCLPVMHLIDVTRSTPYGVQQVQDLLGISSAFDKTVQRLSIAIKKVAKNVLKEHLILVSHCMTCSGNVIGFNTAGYKFLIRSLKVQVPFTEATLATPMKCFERAAEGCHTDLLSSMLAACSWGKRVAVGTGTGFQILWNEQQMPNNEQIGKNAYDFLHLVKTSVERETSSACLGVDVDDIVDYSSSPEHEFGFEGPTFDDNVEIHYNLEEKSTHENEKLEKSTWEKIAPVVDNQDDWQGWGNEKLPVLGNNNDMPPPKLGAWSRFADPVQNENNVSMKPSEEHEGHNYWNKKEIERVSPAVDNQNGWQGLCSEKLTVSRNNNDMPPPKLDAWSRYGADRVQNQANVSIKPSKDHQGLNSWNNKEVENIATAVDNQDGWEGWGNEKLPGLGNNNDMPPPKLGAWSRYGTDRVQNQANVSIKPSENHEGLNSWENKEVEKIASAVDNQEGWQGWGNEKLPGLGNNNDMPPPKLGTGSRYGADCVQNQANISLKQSKDHEGLNSWDNKEVKKIASAVDNEDGWQGWGNKKLPDLGINNEMPPPKLGARSRYVTDYVQNQANASIKPSKEHDGLSSWNNKENAWNIEVQDGWGHGKESQVESYSFNGWSESAAKIPSDPPNSSSDWGSNVTLKSSTSFSNSDGWASQNSNTVATGGLLSTSHDKSDNDGWNKSLVISHEKSEEDGWKKSKVQDGWGRNKDSQSNSHVWNSRTTEKTLLHPRRKPFSPEGISGQRESFSSEEEEIRVTVEPIMQSIRSILHHTRNGDQLSTEDQTYILENVFQFHPDKNAKVVDEVNFLKVDKHHYFQDSRCFFVVSTDGTKSDFSYRKCMEGFIKEKYPEHAESFIRKYFSRPRRPADSPSENESQPQQP